MITNNIAQVAYLNAQLHSCHQIYFVGNFLRHNTISMQRLAYSIDFWSNGETEALFLEHEGYFGALGAFLREQGYGEQPARKMRRRSQSCSAGIIGGQFGATAGRVGTTGKENENEVQEQNGEGGAELNSGDKKKNTNTNTNTNKSSRSGSGPNFSGGRRFTTFG